MIDLVNDIIHKRVQGRSVGAWDGWKSMRHSGHEQHKMHCKTDKRIPQGYKHDSLAKIPMAHYNLKAMQDAMDDAIRQEIRKCPPGPRRDFLIKDYELWVANGRPTYGEFDPKHQPKRYGLKQEVRNAWQDGRPVYMDVKDDREDRRLRRLLGRCKND